MFSFFRVLLLLASLAFAPAQQMPLINGTTLSGKQLSLPSAAEGHVAILCIGFSRAGGDQVKSWAARLSTNMDIKPAVIYQVAELADAPRFLRGMIVHAMKGGTPASEQDHFLVIYDSEKELKQAVGFSRPDDAYILLLDTKGVVQWNTHGAVTDQAVGELTSRIKTLQ